ncbi:MAG TPA: hypothetical protein VNK03_07665 [Gammaproteobacteria bacterium]|nr:hypothetical protein [Gammaproteobacteria bacterium]
MNNELEIMSFLEKYFPVKHKESEKLADQYLSKIVLLQEQLRNEEKKLTQLLQKHGAKILS